MTLRRIAMLQCFIILALAWRTQTAEDTSFQQLGLLLGLPMDRPQPQVQPQATPDFVKEMYNCLNLNGARSTNCVPGYHGSDVNQLRTSLGIEVLSPPAAVHAFNTKRVIKNSLAISFNVSQTWGHSGTVRYALLRTHRAPVATDQLALLRQKCGDLSLQLYTQIGTDNSGRDIYTLQATKPLLDSDLARGEWVEFRNITRLYKSMVESMQQTLGESEVHVTHILRVRLLLRSPTCRSISPSELGFSSTGDHRAQLVGLEETTVEKDFSFSKAMSIIAKQQHLMRSRRQVEEEIPAGEEGGVDLATEAPPTGNTNTTTPSTSSPPTNSPTPANVGDYDNSRCKLYHYTVSFATQLSFNSFVYPDSYTANFCAGHCDWPLNKDEHNKHAFIQSYANFLNDDKIPAPCCVPRPGTLKPLVVVARVGPNEYNTRTYTDMVATECTCL